MENPIQNPARRRRKLEALRVVGERIRLPEPSGHRRRKRWNKFFANVQKSEAGRSKEIFQRSGNVKIEVYRFHVDRPRAAVLVIIEHDQSASTVCQFLDRADLGAKSVFEANVREGHDERVAVDELFVICCRNRIAFCFRELHVGASNSLREPDVPHGGKLKLAHNDFVSLTEIQCAGDAVDAR